MHAYYFHFRCIDLKYLLLSKFWWFIYNWDDNSLFVCLFFTFFGAGNSWATSKSRSRKSWIFALSVQNKLSRSQSWGRFSENRIKKSWTVPFVYNLRTRIYLSHSLWFHSKKTRGYNHSLCFRLPDHVTSNLYVYIYA